MHKYLFLLFVFALVGGLLAARTSSEPEESRLGWGMLYGGNLSHFADSELQNCQEKVGFDLLGGLAFRYELDGGAALRTELILDRARAAVVYDHPYPYVFQSKSTFITTRLKLPVCIEFYGDGYVQDIRPSLGFGGYVAVPVSVQMKEEFDYQSSNTSTGHIDITKDCPSFTPGLQVCAGVRYKHIYWQIRFNHDLVSFRHPHLDVGDMQYRSVEFVIGVIGLTNWLDEKSPTAKL